MLKMKYHWIVLLAVVLSACDVESDPVQSELFVRNNTNHTVNIKTFDYGSDLHVYDIDLQSGEKWYEEFNAGSGGGSVSNLRNDSALLTFNDTLQVSFSTIDCSDDSLDINILCIPPWKSIDPKEGYEYAHEYTITEEVYELAE